ncbi:ATP synthase B chain, putative [Pediculus humanus corporis]|uniref:ATP synthase subunit b n=1 Tax=Pediculus humanus subsp. corporis TaxID=121224 RepID=E0VC38_PEDHC|nr:ATP synthase B chain, putative [Pediculus humanus corporis]EEB10944.1 ATP synthase B chain, putative [Pediculus humanus corporis]
MFEAQEKEVNEPQLLAIEKTKEELEKLKQMDYPVSVIHEVLKAKKENVFLQMESIYRERLMEVHKKIKKQLDFQVEMSNLERKTVQRNLVDYVVSHVMKSITPEQEQNTMNLCIKELNNLALKV